LYFGAGKNLEGKLGGEIGRGNWEGKLEGKLGTVTYIFFDKCTIIE